MIFRDRKCAGQKLAEQLARFRENASFVVLGLPRGGVPVAAEIAQELGAPLDVFVVRKLGVPQHEELAFGAIASGGVRVVDTEIVDELAIPNAAINGVLEREMKELQRRELAYRRGMPAVDVKDRIVILVDDGIATGASMRAAVEALRKLGPARIVVAVPVASPHAVRQLSKVADEVVCLSAPEDFSAVGQWYADFQSTTDEEVTAALESAAQRKTIHAN
ncbi:MAG TPA: phosphoribosyltransferase [Candidatus Acidoferrales bacterium]